MTYRGQWSIRLYLIFKKCYGLLLEISPNKKETGIFHYYSIFIGEILSSISNQLRLL